MYESRLVVFAYDIGSAKDALKRAAYAAGGASCLTYSVRDSQKLRSRHEVNLWIRTEVNPTWWWQQWAANVSPDTEGALLYVNVRENPKLPQRLEQQ